MTQSETNPKEPLNKKKSAVQEKELLNWLEFADFEEELGGREISGLVIELIKQKNIEIQKLKETTL